MIRRQLLGFTLVTAVAAIATPAAAQIFTPSYMAPRASSDIGAYLSDGPGDFAIEGIWRNNFGGYDLGIRAGLADAREVAILLAGEYRNPLVTTAPLDLAVTAAAQAVLPTEGSSAGGFGVGLSLGHTFVADGIEFTPYLHPRLGFVSGFGRDDLDLELLADLGFDVRLTSDLELRFAVAFGDPGADWGIGLAWR